jgi:hypothetical protein
MKYTLTALTALLSIASLTSSPLAEAGNHGISADMPCPYGPGGDPWTASNAISPYSPGYSPLAVTNNTATLTGNTQVINQDGLSFNSAVQYDTYAAPIPAASNCSTTGFSAPEPIEQVMVYNLASNTVGTTTLASGDTEVVFNYDSSLAGKAGTASFTMGGFTYTSTGTLPTTTDNDFVFNSSGQLVGALDNSNGLAVDSGVPTGWKQSGTVAPAPEIDSSLAISAFTLLAGFLAVARGGRRAVRVASRP